ncbi:MAG: nucleotidyltransferase substrate binding protein [Candidatus Omnitrophica bacterium]|nr:nucleotidyltransferase substrate binding protein [Candidatus Omnitrophota bacterium]
MTRESIKEVYEDFKNALERLKEALKEDSSENSIIVDGTIQRFEFTFELSWKLLKFILNYNGVDVDSPRPVIKEAFKTNLIQDGQGWIDMLEDRNKTLHIYDEKQAMNIYNKIKETHCDLFCKLDIDVDEQIFDF